MKRFLIKTTLFLVLGASWMAANFLWNKAQAESANPVEGKDNVRVIAAGDSQILRGFNPTFVPSSIMVAQTAEPYFVTYWKLKKLLPHLKNAETMILSFGPHSFSSYHLDKLVLPSKAQMMFERIYAIEELDELEGVKIDWRALYNMKVKKMCLFPSSDRAPFLSPFENLNFSRPIGAKKAARRHFMRNGKEATEAEFLADYLEKIVDLCQERGIRLVLVSAPVHSAYFKLIPATFQEIYERYKAKYTQQGIQVLDYRQAQIKDSEFLDSNHLNQLGAERFTKMIAAELGL